MNTNTNNKRNITSGLLVSLLICIAMATSGCVGMIFRSVDVDHASFQEVSSGIPSVGGTNARVWILYLVGGPNLWDTSGGPPGYISFNKTVYAVGGRTFMNIDLPSGNCLVTLPRLTSLWKMTFAAGETRRDFVFESGKEYFLRVRKPDLAKGENWLELVERSEAVEEMKGVAHYTQGQATGYRVKELSDF